MGAVTAVSRVLGFVRVLVVAAVLGHHVAGQRLPVRQLGVERAVRAAGGRRAVGGAGPDVRAPARPRRQPRRRARSPAACSAWPWPCSGAVTVVGVVGAPLLARVLTIGVASDVAGEPAGPGHLPAAVLRPPGAAVRRRHDRHRGALRQAPLRRDRGGAHRQHRGHGGVPGRVPAVAGPDPGLDLVDRRALLLVAAGTGGVLAFVGVLLVAVRAPRGSGCGRAARGATREVAAVLRHSGWGVVLHTGGRAAAGRGDRRRRRRRGRRGRLPGRLGDLPRARTRCWPSRSTRRSSPRW